MYVRLTNRNISRLRASASLHVKTSRTTIIKDDGKTSCRYVQVTRAVLVLAVSLLDDSSPTAGTFLTQIDALALRLIPIGRRTLKRLLLMSISFVIDTIASLYSSMVSRNFLPLTLELNT